MSSRPRRRSRTASQRALPRLPEEVRQIGVTAVKSSPNLTMVVHLVSPNGRYDDVYLRNYAVLNVKDQLARIHGMGDVQLFGAGDYAMRVWLDPQKVAARGMTAADVVAAIREQNVQVAAGVVGASPSKDARVPADRQHPGPPVRRSRNSATSSCAPAPTAPSPTCKRRRPHRTRLELVRTALAAEQQVGGRHGHFRSARRQRAATVRPTCAPRWPN